MPPPTPKQKEDFTRMVMSAATRVQPQALFETRLLLTAWAAHESGWGLTRQALRASNLWNVSAGPSWKGPVMAGGDTEYAPGQQGAKRITQQWRLYTSTDAALQDLLRLLRGSRFLNYREGYEELQRGQSDFAMKLGVFERQGGTVVRVDNRPESGSYYTMPRSEYQRGLVTMLDEVRELAAKLKLETTC